MNKWTRLRLLILAYGNACRTDEMKGGRDPADFAEIERNLERARETLENHIQQMGYYERRMRFC